MFTRHRDAVRGGSLRCLRFSTDEPGEVLGSSGKLGAPPLDVARTSSQWAGFQRAGKAITNVAPLPGPSECAVIVPP